MENCIAEDVYMHNVLHVIVTARGKHSYQLLKEQNLRSTRKIISAIV
jgi:hypothetical protein